MRATLPKREKLCSRREIEELLKQGKSFFCYPFKVSCLLYKEDFSSIECNNTEHKVDEESKNKIIVSVPKKKL